MLISKENFTSLLACPECAAKLSEQGEGLVCDKCQARYPIKHGIPILLPQAAEAKSASDEVSNQVWAKIYAAKRDQYDPKSPPLEVATTAKSVREIFRLNNQSDGVFMEAGCGTGRTSLEIALHSKLIVICLDRSLLALLKARRLFEQVKQPAYFICADLRSLPFCDGSLDYVFSDGTIEHFKETRQAVDEFRRVLRKNGQVLAIVPHLALGMLTYGQRQGNIPNIFLIRNLLEFFHVKVMKGRFLVNGFELSFTPGQLKRIFDNFDQRRVGYFRSYNEISLVKNQRLKKLLRQMSHSRVFCPLIYGHGTKGADQTNHYGR